MKIGIDIRCLSEGKRTGVEEYTLNILENIFSLDKSNEYVLFLNSFSKPRIDLEQLRKYPNVSIRQFYFPNKLLNFSFWYLRWPKIDKMLGGVDVFFMPNINFAAFSKKVKVILTIHDLSFEYYPETFSLKRRLWHAFINARRLAKIADKVIAVSVSSKNDLVSTYAIEPEKVAVIRSGVGENFQEMDGNNAKLIATKEEYGLPYYFILFLGTLEPRKNIIGLVRAYNRLRSLNNPELDRYKLVIAGVAGWKHEKIYKEILDSRYCEDIILTGYVCDFDKEYVYNLASLFVYPSFFEGFGFPPLEAMACGVPVIASNNSSLPEIIGSGGVLIDPDKPDELYAAIKTVLLNKDLQENIRKKGLEQARKFRWSRAAEEFLEMIKSNYS